MACWVAAATTAEPGFAYVVVKPRSGGIPAGGRFLRHYFASGLIAQGCDVVTVQRALGHANPAVTLKTYSHLWPTAEDKTRKAAAALMAETLTSDSSADYLRTGEA
ncbi:tyrosine-type recombinase/integrase [Micromonospora sicca]|uniref:tyrosine-type recombinase/integrase n=1 Tax=Micromonospora sicca TaxID=2202420 RepID=UPI0034CEEDAC